MTTSTNTVLTDIEQAAAVLESLAPTIISVVGTFWAPANAVTPFLPLIQTLLQAVGIVQQATGQTTAEATSTVAQHLTPGAPNAPALS